MENLETLILSPAFSVTLAVVAGVLFIILSREFFLWFSKANKIVSKLDQMDEKLHELTTELEKLRKGEVKPQLPPIPQLVAVKEEEKFPLSH